MVKIGIQTWGSEGDVHPFLLLADGLAHAGHEVRLAYSTADGRDYGARLASARYEHRQLESARPSEELRHLGGVIFSDSDPLRQLARAISQLLEPVIDAMTQSACELARWADVLVLHQFAHPLAAAAELAGKPFVCVYLGPPLGIPSLPPPGVPPLGPLNLLAWKLAQALLSTKLIDSVNRVRKRLGLGAVKRYQQQLERSVIDLVAMSPTLLARPDHWPEKVHLAGFFNPPLVPQEKPLAAQLQAFLTAGPAPVYITFGSMSALEREPGAVLEIVERAVAAVGCRAIVQSNLPGPSSPKMLRVSGAIAHDLVFPRCSAIVHHGGAGTTQAALRAGRPSVVVAHMTDQFLWGRQLHRLGIAPRHLTRKTLEPKRLARAIEQATQSAAMRAQAERLGQQMRMEDGVRRAVELIGLQAPR